MGVYETVAYSLRSGGTSGGCLREAIGRSGDRRDRVIGKSKNRTTDDTDWTDQGHLDIVRDRERRKPYRGFTRMSADGEIGNIGKSRHRDIARKSANPGSPLRNTDDNRSSRARIVRRRGHPSTSSGQGSAVHNLEWKSKNRTTDDTDWTDKAIARNRKNCQRSPKVKGENLTADSRGLDGSGHLDIGKSGNRKTSKTLGKSGHREKIERGKL